MRLYVSTASSPRQWLGDRRNTASHQAFAGGAAVANADPRAVWLAEMADGNHRITCGAIVALHEQHAVVAIAPGVTETLPGERPTAPPSYWRSSATREIRYADLFAARMGDLVWLSGR